MITSAHAAAAAGSSGAKPAASAALPAAAARPHADAHVGAAVAQVQRVRVALRAVAHDGHAPRRGSAPGRRQSRESSSPWSALRAPVGLLKSSLRRPARRPAARAATTMRAAVLSELSNMIVACTVARSCEATAVNASARTRWRRRIDGHAIERVDRVLVADDDGARLGVVRIISRSAPVSASDARSGPADHVVAAPRPATPSGTRCLPARRGSPSPPRRPRRARAAARRPCRRAASTRTPGRPCASASFT